MHIRNKAIKIATMFRAAAVLGFSAFLNDLNPDAPQARAAIARKVGAAKSEINEKRSEQ